MENILLNVGGFVLQAGFCADGFLMLVRMGFLGRTRRTHVCRFGLIVIFAALLLGMWTSTLPVAAAPPAKAGAASKKAVNPEARKKAKKFLQQAAQLSAKGKHTNAELVLQKALEADPNWAEVHVARAKCYEALSFYGNAAESWQKAAALSSNKIEYLRGCARDASKAYNWEMAEKAWRAIAAANPQDLEACNMLADIYIHNKNYEEAASWNNDAITIKPKDAQARYTQARLDIYKQDFDKAKKTLKELTGELSSSHPLHSKCVSALEEAELGQRNRYMSWGMYAGIPAAVLLLLFVVSRLFKTENAAVTEPIIDLEMATEDSVCRVLLQYCSKTFELPRGFCWSVSVDRRRLVLQMSQLIGETSGVAQIEIDNDNVTKWLQDRGTAPFLYESELDDVNFQKAFAELIKELKDIRIDVGLPILRGDKLMAFVLLGGSRSTRKDKVRRRFNRYAERVQGVSEKTAMALERIMQRDSRVIDMKTGMWNREYYEKAFNDLQRGCHTANIPMSVFMMRMDQLPEVLERKMSEDTTELLYKVGQLIVKGLSGEMNTTLCHLDNGVFVLLAPERDAKEAEQLAKTLKGCFEKSDVLGPDVRTTGSVAYCVTPEDGEDPVMLRSMLSKTFHDLAYYGGNACKRVVQVDSEAPAEAEAAPREELVIRRTRRPGDNSKPTSYQPFGKARITSNADIADLPDAGSRLSVSDNSNVVSLGAVAIPVLAAAAAPKPEEAKDIHLKVEGNVSTSASKPSAEKTEQAKAADAQILTMLEETSLAAAAKSADKSANKNDEGVNYKLDLKYDDDGVEIETQCCSQEVFEELIGFELEQARENKESCALVYLHIENLEDIRSTGRDNYMKLRRELASLMRAFLREDIDIPGLVNEDDFAVFMTGSAKAAASSLADRLNLTSPNLDAGGYNMSPSLGVVVANGSDDITPGKLLARAKALAKGPGIHYEKE